MFLLNVIFLEILIYVKGVIEGFLELEVVDDFNELCYFY